jgi:outer membrane cobalamin receptor
VHIKLWSFAVVMLLMGVSDAWTQVVQTGIDDSALDSLLNIRVTTASKRWELMEEAPSSVSIVTKEEMRMFGYRTLADVLSAQRGFYTSNDRNYAYVGVRGFGRPSDYNNRILLLVNGHTMNDAFYGAAPMGTEFALDLDAIDRIEIVRGPGSVLYGSGAMFAVVNIIFPSDAGASPFAASAEWGSLERKRASFRLAGEPINGVKGLFAAQWTDAPGGDLHFPEFDSDSTNRGVAQDRDWDRSVGMYTSWSTGSFSVIASYFSRKKGVPTAPYESVFNDPRTQTVDRTAFGELKWESDLRADLGMTIRAFVDRYEYEGDYPYDELYHDQTVADRFGGEAQVRWDLSSYHRFSTGLEFTSSRRSDYQYGTESATLFDGNFPFTALSFYIEDQYQIDRNLSVQAGIRYDRRSTVGNSLVPRASVVYHASPSTILKVLFGEAYRLPNNYELYYEDPISGFRQSNSLRPEQIKSIDTRRQFEPLCRAFFIGCAT